MSIRLGPHVPVINHYLAGLSHAPANHLAFIRRRGGCVLFARTIGDALRSEEAAKRRGRALTPYEGWGVDRLHSEDSGTAGVYDLETDAMVFPTSYVARDVEALVLHELGHALTMPVANIDPALLKNLPREIANQVHASRYRDPHSRKNLRDRVFEALAHGYVYVLLGRHHELPGPLLSELTSILNTIEVKRT